MEKRANLLRDAPQPWLRRVHNFSTYGGRRRTRGKKDRHPSFWTKGSYIYCIYSTKLSKVYVGQTGGRRSRKSIIQRWRQHCRSARSFHTLYGARGVKNLGALYPTMAATGIENRGITILECCTPSQCNRRERFWIRKMGATMNVRDTPIHSRRWELLFRAKISEAPPESESINKSIQSILTARHRTMSLPQQLGVLNRARKCIAPDIVNQVFQKVRHNVKIATGITLPPRMTVRIPQFRGIDGRTIRDKVSRHISKLPLPTHLRQYYVTRLGVVGVKGHTVRDILCNRGVKASMSEIHTLAHTDCHCSSIAQSLQIPLLEGHLVVRNANDLRKLFGLTAPLVMQDLRGEAIVDWRRSKNVIINSLGRALVGLPAVTYNAQDMYSEILSHVRSAWLYERAIQPWFAREEAIRHFRKEHESASVFLPLDKNEGRCVCMCKTYYYKKLLCTYADEN